MKETGGSTGTKENLGDMADQAKRRAEIARSALHSMLLANLQTTSMFFPEGLG
jgi:hypothetical protein